MPSLYNLSLNELQDYTASKGFKPFVAKQVFSWL
ncbi:hypothetical protein, partial [Helicobacter heilmannii]